MQIAAGTHTGLVRTDNEDSHCAVDLRPAWPGYAVAVADGMGGYEAGEIASSVAIAAFTEAIQAGLPRLAAADGTNPGTGLQTLVAEAIETAHQAVQAEANGRGIQRMGSTLTAALIRDGQIVWGHIGDSRLYRLRAGKATQLSSDHSVVGELIRQGELTEREAMVHPKRNLLTQALGTPEALDVETGSEPAQAGDIFVLCSDGLTNLVHSGEIVNIIGEHVDQAPHRLIALANERGGHDNITVVVVAL